MKKRIKWIIGGGVCALLCVVGILLFGRSWQQAETSVVSAGVQLLADRAQFTHSAVQGETLCFTPEWFDTALCGDRIQAITVTKLPDVTAGELMLGYGEVSVGQTVRRENLSYLSFVPTGSAPADFSFVPETKDGVAGFEVSCTLTFTDGVNCCPVGRGASVAVNTHEGLACVGQLDASDPEGDALCFEVVRYPEGGTLTLDAASGRFVYTPMSGFTGEDSFEWRVQDVYGNYAESATTALCVKPLTTGYLFADMTGNGAHSAALTVTEAGLLSGKVVAGKHYFHPERTLTRAAFVTILLEAAEVKYEPANSTRFTDDADIPHPMKGAIKHASEQGWLGEDTVFRPNDPITRAEAAKIAAAVLGLSAPGYSDAVKDHDNIPVSLADVLYAAFEEGYLPTLSDGSLAHDQSLTRAQAALLFARVLESNAA